MTKRRNVEPLGSAVRVTDPDYPGVVRRLGDGYRVAVSMDCDRYVFQARFQTDEGERWFAPGGRGPATLEKLIEKHGATVEGLAEACADLPADPAQAAPDFKAAREALLDVIERRRMTNHDYGRVIRQDGNWRLIVDPEGQNYRWMWLDRQSYLRGPSDDWICQKTTPSLSELRDDMVNRSWDSDAGFPWDRDKDALAVKVEAFLHGLPERASDGEWPDLPALP